MHLHLPDDHVGVHVLTQREHGPEVLDVEGHISGCRTCEMYRTKMSMTSEHAYSMRWAACVATVAVCTQPLQEVRHHHAATRLPCRACVGVVAEGAGSIHSQGGVQRPFLVA